MKKTKQFLKVFCVSIAIISFFFGIFVLLQFDEQNIKIAKYLHLSSYQKYEVAKKNYEEAEAKKNISVDSKLRYEKLRCSFLSSKSHINQEMLMICAIICIVTTIISCIFYGKNIISWYYQE